MDSVKSIMGYGKVDDAQDLVLKRKTRKRVITVGVSVIVLLAVIISTVVAVVAVHDHSTKRRTTTPELTPAASLKAVCSVTQFPASCVSSISKIPSSANMTDPEDLFRLSLKVIVEELGLISDLPEKLVGETDVEIIKTALDVCAEMLDYALDLINDVGEGKKIDDLVTWLTAALTAYDTCVEAFDETEYANSTISMNLKSAMKNSTEFTSNSLSIAARILSTLSGFRNPRRLLVNSNAFPNWVNPGVRRLLQSKKNVTPNVTVAADGSGDVRTVNEAVAKIPEKGETMFVIYVKSGTYVENVVMGKNKWNIMIYGDGKTKTIISGSKYCSDEIRTFKTATFAIQGKGFIMKNIGIINTAGAKKSQAVAFRSQSDRSVYYQCSFDGYQDTLYPHSHRQFYRECDITGTIDFIFGNAAVVFQGCNILPRQPLRQKYNTITAQGKTHPDMNSGISIQRCVISGNGNVTVPTYLGRPWRDHATTMVMQSEIGSVVSPAGWISWSGKAIDDPPKSVFYAENNNTGPGSDVAHRVKWAHVVSDFDVGRFTVSTFLQGGEWLPSKGVPYQLV